LRCQLRNENVRNGDEILDVILIWLVMKERRGEERREERKRERGVKGREEKRRGEGRIPRLFGLEGYDWGRFPMSHDHNTLQPRPNIIRERERNLRRDKEEWVNQK
jgi:hypothetical protein